MKTASQMLDALHEQIELLEDRNDFLARTNRRQAEMLHADATEIARLRQQMARMGETTAPVAWYSLPLGYIRQEPKVTDVIVNFSDGTTSRTVVK